MAYTKLTDVLTLAEPAKHYAIYRRMLRAIRDGELDAVATAERVELPSAKGPRQVRQHAFTLPAEDAYKLLMKERERTPKHAVSLDDLEAGRVSFEEAAQRYRDSLKPKQTARRTTRRKKGE